MSYLNLAEQAAKRAQARAELDQIVLPLKDESAERRRLRLLAKLAAHPGLLYVVETEPLPDGSLVLALAIPGATLEVTVPKPRDPFDFACELIALVGLHTSDKSDKCDRRRSRRRKAGIAWD